MQYDLDGSITVTEVDLCDDILGAGTHTDMAVDATGDVYMFMEIPSSGGSLHPFVLFKLDGATGEILIDEKLIYSCDPYFGANPNIEETPAGDAFYLMWIADDELGATRLIMFSIIDTNGDFIESPYVAYDYTDEDPENLYYLSVASNELGDVFAIWSEGDIEVGGYWIALGWFDHNWLGIEDETASPAAPDITLSLSSNPFHDFLTIEVDGISSSPELSFYDITGRVVRTLEPGDGESFLWDGTDSEGNQLPSGTYVVRAETQGITATAKVVKLD
jgi:hypothetical protein